MFVTTAKYEVAISLHSRLGYPQEKKEPKQ